MQRIKRPLEVKILLLFITLIGAWNLLRLFQAVSSWSVFVLYEQLGAAKYLVISGGVWFLTCALLSFGVWFCKTWALKATLGISLGYILWQVMDMLLSQGSPSKVIFSLSVNIIMTVIFYSLLFSKNVKRYFHGKS